MRIYQVLVIGSFVALAACKADDADVASEPPIVAQTPANDAGEQTARDENGRPVGATDPIRNPTP